MARFVRWFKSNADGVVALVTAVVIAVLGVLDILGTNQVSAAILLTLALLAPTLLRHPGLPPTPLGRRPMRPSSPPSGTSSDSRGCRSRWACRGPCPRSAGPCRPAA